MMTKKTYETFANYINKHMNGNSVMMESLMAFSSDIFAKDNPRFNNDKYKEACFTGKHIRKSIKNN